MSEFTIETKEAIEASDLTRMLAKEWESLRATSSRSGEDPRRGDVLSSEFADLFQVSPEDKKMGFALTGAAFIVALKALAANPVAQKIGEVVFVALAEKLLDEAFKRLRRKNGADALEYTKNTKRD